MKICGLQGVSLIDFPGRVASVLFLGGCNFRCPFCQNVSLVKEHEQLPVLPEGRVLDFLKQRKGFIDGVTLTGGEPLLNGGEMLVFLRKLRQTGLCVKLDTNGYETDTLVEVLKSGLVDYVAMDVKAGMDRYHTAAGRAVDTGRLRRSVRVIMESSIEYEFRTTCVPGLVEEEDIESIGRLIAGAEHYYLQQFKVVESVLDPSYAALSPYPKDRLEKFLGIARAHVKWAAIRGI